jgi:hypothetical protein
MEARARTRRDVGDPLQKKDLPPACFLDSTIRSIARFAGVFGERQGGTAWVQGSHQANGWLIAAVFYQLLTPNCICQYPDQYRIAIRVSGISSTSGASALNINCAKSRFVGIACQDGKAIPARDRRPRDPASWELERVPPRCGAKPLPQLPRKPPAAAHVLEDCGLEQTFCKASRAHGARCPSKGRRLRYS